MEDSEKQGFLISREKDVARKPLSSFPLSLVAILTIAGAGDGSVTFPYYAKYW